MKTHLLLLLSCLGISFGVETSPKDSLANRPDMPESDSAFVRPTSSSRPSHSRPGQYSRAIDLHLGFGNSIPQGFEAGNRPKGNVFNKIGLAYECPPLSLGGFKLPVNLAMLYNTKSLVWSNAGSFNQWHYSNAGLQAVFHHFLAKRWKWLEAGLLLEPNYTLDLIITDNQGNSFSANDALKGLHKFSLEAGPVLLINFFGFQTRAYYVQNLVRQHPPSRLVLSAWGADFLIPLQKKRMAP